jgi:hypothetical protein
LRAITVQQRRRLLVQRHHLHGDASGPEEVAKSLLALHATDPATIYLSVLARSSTSTLSDVAAAMYERRTLVRWMAMRRTLFVFPTEDVPEVQAAVSTPLAATLHRQILGRIARNGTDPAIDSEPGAWLKEVESAVEDALLNGGPATGAQLASSVPALRTSIHPGSPSQVEQNLTSPLLTAMSAAGLIVRGTATGHWTSRHHLWEPVGRWWPDGLPLRETGESQAALAHRWLERFGPATFDDLQWWTGWNKTTTRTAISTLPIEEIDLHGQAGIALLDDSFDGTDGPPTAALLPALDPTPMGWKRRAWFVSVEPAQIFDTSGNIGPTVWWNGEAIGSWAVSRSGEVRTIIAADRGPEARTAVDIAAEQLQTRLEGTVPTPSIRTHLEVSLGRTL